MGKIIITEKEMDILETFALEQCFSFVDKIFRPACSVSKVVPTQEQFSSIYELYEMLGNDLIKILDEIQEEEK